MRTCRPNAPGERGCNQVAAGVLGTERHPHKDTTVDGPKAKDNADFEAVALPVSADYLREEGLGEAFVEYMDTWRGFVSPAA